MKKIKSLFLSTIVLFVAGMTFFTSAGTIDDVKDRGSLTCGVSTGLPGFSDPDSSGKWTGIDVDFCRAVAAAVLGDASKVKFVPLTAKERFTALQSGEIDVLSRNTTWTLTRDASLGLNFTGVVYYDGQGFMVPSSLGVSSALELDGASVCIQTGTTTELNLADYFRSNNLSYEAITYDSYSQSVAGFESGRCDVFTTDQSGLYATRAKLENPDNFTVLPDVISKEPLGPAVRQGDDDWFNLVKWTLFAMLNAEELGINSQNISSFADSNNPNIRRLLGQEGSYGNMLYVDADWVVQIISQVGNYGEVFEANLGANTPLKISRGINALWSQGGIQYAPPVR